MNKKSQSHQSEGYFLSLKLGRRTKRCSKLQGIPPSLSNKKGAQHLEMIIAFMLFASFSFFMLYFIHIPKQNKLAESSIDILKNKFEHETYINLTKISLKLSSPQVNCFLIDLAGIDSNAKSIVRDESYSLISSSFDSNSGTIKINSNKEFFFIYLSPDFINGNLGECNELQSENYEIGGVEKLNVVSYKKIKDLESKYNDNNQYENLKSTLGISSNLDFSIKTNIKDVTMETAQPEDSVAAASTFTYQVLYSDGKIEIKEITFKIWP